MILSSGLALNTFFFFFFFSSVVVKHVKNVTVPSEISEINSQACFRALKNVSNAWPSRKTTISSTTFGVRYGRNALVSPEISWFEHL